MILSREATRLLAALAAPEPMRGLTRSTRRLDHSPGGGRRGLGRRGALLASGRTGVAGGRPRRGWRRRRLTIAAAGLARLRREQGGEIEPFRAQHLGRAGAGAANEPPLRDASESPLAWMARRPDRDGRPMIDPIEYEAGERLRRDITQALMLPKMGTDWTAPRVDGGGAARCGGGVRRGGGGPQRVRTALAAVGHDLSDLLLDLCGFLKGLERIEAERRWPARSAKVVARIALARLAEHYGLEREARGPDQAARACCATGPEPRSWCQKVRDLLQALAKASRQAARPHGVAMDALDHRPNPVKSVWTSRGHRSEAAGIDQAIQLGRLLRGLARVERDHQGDEAADDERVAEALQQRCGVPPSSLTDVSIQTWLSQP